MTGSRRESLDLRQEATSLSVLVVDDDVLIRRLLGRVLASWGFDCVVVATAEQALRQASSRDFDALLSDQHLGSALGVELLDEIERRLNATARPLPAMLIMSGVDADYPRPHLAKPFSLDVLRSSLHREIRRAAKR